MIVSRTFFDRDVRGRPVRSWWVHGSQPEHVLYMRRIVDAYRRSTAVRQLAVWIVFHWAGCPPKRKARHALAIARWVQRSILYVNEGQETFQTPLATLRLGFGDCDDMTILICALCEAIGIPTQIVAMQWAGSYRHVFPAAVILLVGGRPLSLALDATLRAPVGKANPVALSIRRGQRPRVLVM